MSCFSNLGLKLHGVLSVMRHHTEGAMKVLLKTEETPEAVRSFFIGVFADPNSQMRQYEELVVDNFYRYLTQLSSKYIKVITVKGRMKWLVCCYDWTE